MDLEYSIVFLFAFGMTLQVVQGKEVLKTQDAIEDMIIGNWYVKTAIWTNASDEEILWNCTEIKLELFGASSFSETGKKIKLMKINAISTYNFLSYTNTKTRILMKNKKPNELWTDLTDPTFAMEVLISEQNHMVLRMYESGNLVFTLIVSRQDHILKELESEGILNEIRNRGISTNSTQEICLYNQLEIMTRSVMLKLKIIQDLGVLYKNNEKMF